MPDFSRQSVHKQEVLASKRTHDTPFPIGEKMYYIIDKKFFGNACDLVAEEEEKVVGVRVAKERQR